MRRLVRRAGPLWPDLLDLARADAAASADPRGAHLDALGERAAHLDQGGIVSRLRVPLGGDTLMALTGRGPGMWIGRAKDAVEEAIIEGTLEAGDSAAALRWLQEHRADLLLR